MVKLLVLLILVASSFACTPSSPSDGPIIIITGPTDGDNNNGPTPPTPTPVPTPTPSPVALRK